MSKHKKIDKHFGIKVNHQKVKILNYKMDRYYDELENREIETIELITKIPHKVFNQEEVLIEIIGVDVIIAQWCGGFHQPGLNRYKYKLSPKGYK
ncbi:hypothetical protein IM538_04035 [Cytobacillus suaedae]|nr:hypothetical protein IM538_04035 [Cytobacillus suaedae]